VTVSSSGSAVTITLDVTAQSPAMSHH
jgi:hypothetical protein